MAFTLEFMDGFDNYLILTQKWASFTTAFFVTGVGRGGSTALQTGGGTSTTGQVVSPTLASAVTRIVGFAFYLNPSSATTKTLVQLRFGATNHIDVRAAATAGGGSPHAITVTRNGTSIAASSTNALPGEWNHICLKATIGDPTDSPAGSAILMLNGVETLSLAGIDTRNASTAATNTVLLSGLGTTYYDDFYTGTSDITDNSDMPGDLRVGHLRPNAAGDSTDFVPLPSGPNWSVAAQSISGAETQWVQSRTPGATDLYNLHNAPTTTVYAVAPYMYARRDDAGARVARLVVKSGATTETGSNLALSENYALYSRLYTTDPDTSVAWTAAGVDALQVGPKVES